MNYEKSQWLKKYIKDVSKNRSKGKNQQLYEAFNSAIEKVLKDPTSKEFSKHTIEPYKAVNVLQQVRLFFKVENQYNVIFFVWMNDLVEFPHDSSKGDRDKCYKEFKRLKENDKLEIYTPKVTPNPNIKINGKFRVDSSFFASIEMFPGFASTQITINKTDNNEYSLDHINESDYEISPLQLLISNICNDAISSNITLICVIEKYRGKEYTASIQKALIANQFVCEEDNDELSNYKFN